MNSLLAWLGASGESFAESLRSLGTYLPSLLAALALLLAGWLLGRLLRRLFVKLGDRANVALVRFGQPRGYGGLHLSPNLMNLLGNVAFWISMLVFAAMAARIAGLDAFSGWLGRVVVYLPTLFAGGLIVLAGYLVSKLVRDLVVAALVSTGSTQSELLGLGAQSAIFLTAIVIGLDQVGIDVTFLITLLAILLGGAVLSLAIAFGLGARDFVGNLIAAQQARGVIEPGQLVSVAEQRGRVLEITLTSVVILTDVGRVFIPATAFQQQITAILAEDDDE
jgi:hypothetical protein